MKQLASLLFLALLLTGCYQQERNCAAFKTGKFRAEFEVNGKKTTSVFERTDKISVETFEGKTDTSSVRWINDCECIQQKINPKNTAEKKAVDMKILTTKGDSYTFEFSIVGDTHKQRGTVTRIK